MTAPRRKSAPFESFVKDKPSQRAIKELCLQLRRGQISGPEAVAEATAKLLRTVASGAKFRSLQELVDILKAAGRELQYAQPKEQCTGNITRRVVHLLREEAKIAENQSQTPPLVGSLANLSLSPGTIVSQHQHQISSNSRPGPSPLRKDSAFMHGSFSISDLVAAGAMASSTMTTPAETPSPLSRSGSGFFNQPQTQAFHSHHLSITEDPNGESNFSTDDSEEEETISRGGAGAYWLKPVVVQAIQEVLDELEGVDENITKDARDHIHSGEVILTVGHSKTAELFFKAAAKDRKFTVIVAETAPSFEGHGLARELSRAGISTLLVPDASVFAVMPRVSKVVLGAHAILANGGLLSCPGSLLLASSARAHSTPIVVLAGIYKICPEWGASLEMAGGSSDPSEILNFASAPSIIEHAEIVNPQWDYVRPELVDVFITNLGEHPPSYVYRLVKENYDETDIIL